MLILFNSTSLLRMKKKNERFVNVIRESHIFPITFSRFFFKQYNLPGLNEQ